MLATHASFRCCLSVILTVYFLYKILSLLWELSTAYSFSAKEETQDPLFTENRKVGYCSLSPWLYRGAQQLWFATDSVVLSCPGGTLFSLLFSSLWLTVCLHPLLQRFLSLEECNFDVPFEPEHSTIRLGILMIVSFRINNYPLH